MSGMDWMLDGPSPRAWGERTHMSIGHARISDHPHARGENIPIRRSEHLPCGPSPRAWGERHDACLSTVSHDGPSPRAWGERHARVGTMPPCPDHPHARGENSTPEDCAYVHGPSPRAWGELLSRNVAIVTDHPHARGENADADPTRWADVRTIPTRVGRTHARSRRRTVGDGPSPRAWGERRIESASGSLATDHPHARGENARRYAASQPGVGPSPRAWGERDCDRAMPRRTCGPSPRAWGEPGHAADACYARADHPHARGENAIRRDACRVRMADHPHARGENGQRQS